MSSIQQFTSETVDFRLTPDRLRVWGIRSGLSVMDQGLSSGAGFLLNLFLARWLQAEAYGAFAVAFASVVFLSGFHSALLIEPMTVVGPARYPGCIVGYCLTQIKLHFSLSCLLSLALLIAAAIIAVGGSSLELVWAVAASALTLPFLLLFWTARRMCYLIVRPSWALWGSAGYLFLIVLGLFAMRKAGAINPAAALLLLGVASILATAVVLWKLRLFGGSREPLGWKEALLENWNYGRWLAASAILLAVASQVQTYIVAAMMGLGAAGVLRAMQIPSLVMTQIVTAFGLLVLPSLATEFGRSRIELLRKKALITTGFLTILALINASLLWMVSRPVEKFLYAGRFSGYVWLIPTLALIPVLTGFAMGFSMALRACQKPRFELFANAVAAPIGLVTALVFTRRWGMQGAVISLLLGYTAYAMVFLTSFAKINWSDIG